MRYNFTEKDIQNLKEAQDTLRKEYMPMYEKYKKRIDSHYGKPTTSTNVDDHELARMLTIIHWWFGMGTESVNEYIIHIAELEAELDER